MSHSRVTEWDVDAVILNSSGALEGTEGEKHQ